jgi:hypothetical protein
MRRSLADLLSLMLQIAAHEAKQLLVVVPRLAPTLNTSLE